MTKVVCIHSHSYQLSKLQNDLLVSRKALPEKTKLEEELTTAQVEVRVGGGEAVGDSGGREGGRHRF